MDCLLGSVTQWIKLYKYCFIDTSYVTDGAIKPELCEVSLFGFKQLPSVPHCLVGVYYISLQTLN